MIALKKTNSDYPGNARSYIYGMYLCLPFLLLNITATQIVAVYLLTIFFLHLKPLFKATNLLALTFQSAQLLNILSLNNTIYTVQIVALIVDTEKAINMGFAEGSPYGFAIAFMYLTAGLLFLRNTNHIKFSAFTFPIFALSTLLTLLTITQGFTFQHKPLWLYIVDHALDRTESKKIAIGPEVLNQPNGASPKTRIILIIGESQSEPGRVSQTSKHHPFTTKEEEKGNLIRFTNMSQLAPYTALAHKIILNAADLDSIEEEHANLTSPFKALDIPTFFFSSRNSKWGELRETTEKLFNHTKGCEDVHKQCSLLSGTDDLKFMIENIYPIIHQEKFFITWQMNGSHIPLNDKSPEAFKISENEYDNSTLYTDHILGQLFSQVDENTYIFFMSDHSHKHNNSDAIVSAFMYKKNLDLQVAKQNKHAPLTQMDFINTIHYLTGYNFNISNSFNILTQQIPKARIRKTFLSHNKSNYKLIKETGKSHD